MKERESNMELLRIASMLMVLMVHFDAASVGFPSDVSLAAMDARDWWRLVTESAVIIGVNCFTLISGYFGIRLRVRSTAGFWFECVAYSVAIASMACLLKPEKFDLVYWADSWLVLSHPKLWYVPAYFMLMLVSPLVNRGMAALTVRQNIILTSIFVAWNIWGGWVWWASFNPTGYTPIQLIMVYMIGRCIRLSPRVSESGKWIWAVVYFLATALVLFSAIFVDCTRGFAYNSPFVLLQSVAFFMFFLGLRLRSRLVNFLARSAFAVYLVHMSPALWGGALKPFMVSCWRSMELWQYALLVPFMAVVIYLAVVPLDMVRRRVWSLMEQWLPDKEFGKQSLK